MEENDNKKRKRRILFLLFLLLITGILASTSTYAWFSVNRIVYVETIDVKVEAQGGLELSVDAINWKTFVTSSEISAASETYSTAVSQLPAKMEPVSTGGILNLVTGRLNMYYGSAEGNIHNTYTLSAYKINEQNLSGEDSDGKYIAFDLFIKLIDGAGEGNLYLTNESGAAYSGDATPGIQNAIRYAFVVLGSKNANESVNSLQNIFNPSQDEVYIWEPNYDVHNETAIDNAFNVYNKIVTTTGNERLDYDGIIDDIPSSVGVTLDTATKELYPQYFKQVEVDYQTVESPDENTRIFTIPVGVTKMRVYIWLEGQDVDCENHSAIGNISFKFQFTTNPL